MPLRLWLSQGCPPKETMPYSDRGYYVIVSIEGDNEAILEDQGIIVGDLCTANGALEVFFIDPVKIWRARKSLARRTGRAARSFPPKT